MSTASSPRQRVVILPGPHKTGTTSVQSFLTSLTKKQLLGNWTWPASSSKAFSDVAHSIFFDPEDKHGNLRRKRENIQKIWKKGYSIAIGAELFDYVGATLGLGSPAELPAVFERLYSIFPQKIDPFRDMTAVVMYRTPRSSHLISAWKQQLAMGKRKRGRQGVWRAPLQKEANRKYKKQPPSLSEWLCTGEWQGKVKFHMDKILAAQLAPMSVASAFSKFGNTSVVIGDMSGMEDISNAVACEVLQVPCTNEGMVVGYNKTRKVLNQRSNPVELGLNKKEIEQVEDILRRMDCYHYCELRPHVTILHANDSMFTEEEGWNDCCSSPEAFLSPSQALEKIQNIGCRASDLQLNSSRTQPTSTHQHVDFVESLQILSGQDSILSFPWFMLACNALAAFGLLRLQVGKRRRNNKI